jgi:hypothetical protein
VQDHYDWRRCNTNSTCSANGRAEAIETTIIEQGQTDGQRSLAMACISGREPADGGEAGPKKGVAKNNLLVILI